MAEKPILFNGEMVRAILDGRKTQTRRADTKPRYAVGDLMWVRETWRVGGWNDDFEFQVDYQADDFNGHDFLVCEDDEMAGRLAVQSSAEAAKVFGDSEYWAWEPGESPCRWRPSIHMPKWAARIWLRVTDVRLERVQDISEEDARAEGIQRHAMGWTDGANGYDVMTARDAFAELWDDVYPGSWDRDDWVWVYAFVRTERPNGGAR